MRETRIHRLRGNLLVETPIVVAAIGLLTALAMLVYRGGAEDARLASARAEVRALADAQNAAAAAHGFYVPLQVLDDFPASSAASSAASDNISNDAASGAIYVIDPSRPPEAQLDSQSTLPAVTDWKGPFFEPKRIHYGGFDIHFSPTQVEGSLPGTIRRDHPLDPWGHPYRFYSPLGIIGSRAAQTGVAAMNGDAFSDGKLTSIDPRFTAYAIVSHGPNGVSNSETPAGEEHDDIIMFLAAEGESAGA